MVVVLLALICLAAAFASGRSAGRVLGLVFAVLGVMLIVPVAFKELAQLLGFGCLLCAAFAYMLGARSWSRSFGLWGATLLLFASLWKPIVWLLVQGLRQVRFGEIVPAVAVGLLALGLCALALGAREQWQKPRPLRPVLRRTRRRAALVQEAEALSDALPEPATHKGDDLDLFERKP